MPGVFSKEARPVRPGAYFDWAAEPTDTILPSIGSVVLLGIVHDCAPAEQVVPTVSSVTSRPSSGRRTHPATGP